MGVSNSELKDLIATTLDDLPDGQFEVMWDSQHFEFAKIYQQNRRTIDGGDQIQRNVVLDRAGTAKYRRLYASDQPSVENFHKTIRVPWTQMSVDYSWDVFELKRNMSNSTKGFISLLETRRVERLWDLAELIEDRGWRTPTDANDDLYPYGIPYYLNHLDDGTTDTGSYSGKTIRFDDGTTGTVCAGLDANTYSKWRNYGATYTSIDNTFLRRLRQAIRRTRFRPAAMIPDPSSGGMGSPIKMYGNDDVVTELEDLADKRDDNTAPQDLSGKIRHDFDGAVMFNRIPIVYIPQLDGYTVTGGSGTVNTTDPLYCVDWTKLIPVVHDGYWMVEGEPLMDRNQHTTVTVFVDAAHNNLCINRRKAGFVLHKEVTA